MAGKAPVQAATAPRFVDDYLAALLARASERVSAEFHAVVRAAGVPVAEWRILASLSGGEPLTVGGLAQRVLAPQSTVTRQLDRLAAKGLIERVAAAGDRRLALVRTTAAGEALALRLVAEARAHEQRVLAWLNPAEVAVLKAQLRAVIGAPAEATAALRAPAAPAASAASASARRPRARRAAR